jgi:hypothetical protein
MKKGNVMLLVLLAAAAVVIGAAASLIRRGFSAREQPSVVESYLATSVRNLAVPSRAKHEKNPFVPSSELLAEASAHFANHCAVCHADDGSGDTLFGKGLYPKPPDMRMRGTQRKSDGELYYTIENGIRLSGMPAFGEEGTGDGDPDTWKLVLFIRHLPNLNAAELKHMEQLNPKTDEERREEKEEEEFLRGNRPQAQSSKSHHE